MRMICLALLFLTSVAQAQNEPHDCGVFSRVIKISENWKKDSFRLTAKVKAAIAHENSGAGIWLRIDNSNKKLSFFDNMEQRKVVTDDWTNVQISGRFKENDSVIMFGGIYTGPGTYGFTDLRLEQRSPGGDWHTIPQSEIKFTSDSTRKSFARSSGGPTGTFSVIDGALRVDATVLKPREKANPNKATYGNNAYAGKTVKVNGISIYYEEYGAGEPVVLLHGNSQRIEAFTYLIPELSKKYKVIAIDTRLHGKSGDDGKRLTYELFAEDVKALLDHLKPGPVHLLGWSDGGNTGLILAMKYPQLIRSLMMMGAVLSPDSSAIKPEVISALKKATEKLPPEKEKARRLYTLCLEEPHIPAGDLKMIKCPTLVMAGENDMVQDAHTRLIAASIPSSKLVIFDKATHFAPFEIPDLFRKTVEDFLSEHK